MAIGTGVSILGQQKQAEASAESAQQQIDQLSYQQAQANADASAEKSSARLLAENLRRKGRMQQATARSQLAASGVDVGYGTASLINETIKRDTEVDALTAILDGESRASRLRAQGIGYGIEASNVAKNAKAEASASRMKIGSSVLAGGFSIASGWKSPFAGGVSGGGMAGGGSFSG